MENPRPRLRPVEVRQVRVSGRPMVCLFDPTHASPKQVCLSPESFFVASHLDGRHTLRDVQAAYMRQFGTLLFSAQIHALIEHLDENLLLESPRYRTHLERETSTFARADVRAATHAGTAYPADPHDLAARLEEVVPRASREPGVSYPPGSVLEGAVLPHIDLERGAAVYGPSYAALSALGGAPTVVLLGTAHGGLRHGLALTRKAFETPLGRVETNGDWVDALLDELGHELLADEYAHKHEHSVEIQVVLLKHVFGRGTFRILPVLCGLAESADGRAGVGPSVDRMARFGCALARLRRRETGGSAVLASADLAHVGPQFGDARPVGPAALARCEAHDRELLDLISAQDAQGFLDRALEDGNRLRVCGVAPIYVLLRTVVPSSSRLVGYRQAVDPRGYGMVSFCGMVFYRERPRP